MRNEADQRKFRRRMFDARVRIHDCIKGRTSPGVAVNVNPMGMFVQTRRHFAVGEVLNLEFPSPEGDHQLTVTGAVVRAEGNGPKHRAGVAVEFFDLDDWIFEELYNYVYSGHEAVELRVSVQPPA